MTLPDERYRSMLQIRQALIDFATQEGRLKKSDVRDLVRRLLRHYPSEWELERIAKACPELLNAKEWRGHG